MKPLLKSALIVSATVVGALIITKTYSALAAKTETQPYKVLQKEGAFEIRSYPPAIMATVSMMADSYKKLSSTGFRRLAAFIFGGNKEGESIAMTSPVHMDINKETASSMSFVMPAKFTKENLPKPNDSGVTIETAAPEYVAAIRFSGYADDQSIEKYTNKLKEALAAKGIAHDSNFRFLGYAAPYKVLNRRNEIIVGVKWER